METTDTQITLPDIEGLLSHLFKNLSGKGGSSWLKAFKRFLRKQDPWPEGIIHAIPFTTDFIGPCERYLKIQDERSQKLLDIDLADVDLVSCLQEGEEYITYEEKLVRLKTTGDIMLDPRFFMTLWKTPKMIPDSWKKKIGGEWPIISFDGSIVCDAYSTTVKIVMCLYHNGNDWRYENRSLDQRVYANCLSAVISK